jgi:hypothetical protein
MTSTEHARNVMQRCVDHCFAYGGDTNVPEQETRLVMQLSGCSPCKRQAPDLAVRVDVHAEEGEPVAKVVLPHLDGASGLHST